MPKTYKSPHFNARASASDIRFVVLHYTETADIAETFRLFDERQVSSHYVVDIDGAVHAPVGEGKRAWHAGESHWSGISDVNSHSIGIELQNSGAEDYTDTQMAALVELLGDIEARHAIGHAGLLGHSDVAPARKQDPGAHFPWAWLARQGFGIFPDSAAEAAQAEARELPALLRAIGYGGCETADFIAAFQRRYRSEHISGVADGESAGLARAILRELGLL